MRASRPCERACVGSPPTIGRWTSSASWLQNKGAGVGRKFEGDYYTPPEVPDLNPLMPPGSTVPTWPGAGPGRDFSGALPNPDDPYLGTADEPQFQNATVYTATILVGWEGDQLEFDSITG